MMAMQDYCKTVIQMGKAMLRLEDDQVRTNEAVSP
jgi:hypothetical protein